MVHHWPSGQAAAPTGAAAGTTPVTAATEDLPYVYLAMASDLNAADLAAWTDAARVVLNLHEFINRD